MSGELTLKLTRQGRGEPNQEVKNGRGGGNGAGIGASSGQTVPCGSPTKVLGSSSVVEIGI